MKKAKYGMFEHVFDKYGNECIIIERTLAKDDWLYKVRDIDRGIDCCYFEFELYRKDRIK